MRSFDTVVVVDWSAASSPSRPGSADAIWYAAVRASGAEPPRHCSTRAEAMERLGALAEGEAAAGRRLLMGFDFAMGYPEGAARAIAGTGEPLALWDWMAAELRDGRRNRNDRLELADRVNARLPGDGPYWGRPRRREDLRHLGEHRPKAPILSPHRVVEERLRAAGGPGGRPNSVWQMFYPGSVGGQSITGMAALAGLRRRLGPVVAVWPFEPTGEAAVVLAEVYPALIDRAVREAVGGAVARGEKPVRDAVQVALLARALAAVQAAEGPARLFAAPDPAARWEGWILGADLAPALDAAARGSRPEPPEPGGAPAPGPPPSGRPAGRATDGPGPVAAADAPDARRTNPAPPPLRDDCFALPPGVDWTPVDAALARLREALRPATGVEAVAVVDAAGRVLARDAVARRASPPGANAAVDGYGFAHASAGPDARTGCPSSPAAPPRAPPSAGRCRGEAPCGS